MKSDSLTSGSRFDPATVDLSGRCVGSSYILVCPIGRGATGTVWRAIERASGEHVAVKLLHESLLRQPKLVTRFVQERTILLMLRHENIVRVRDLFSVGESLGLVMDLVPGGTLRDHLRREGTVAVSEAARLLAQVAAALAEAHGLGVVHRDLKPDNILLRSEDGRLDTRLTDFGVARVLDVTGLTTPNAVVGTPHYMAPEAITGGRPGSAVDVYALGVLLYELVIGHPPYVSESVAALLRCHMDDSPERHPGVPDPAWDLITSCMDKDPERRPSATDLIGALRDLGRATTDVPALPPREAVAVAEPEGVPAAEHPSTPPRPRRIPHRRNRPNTWRWARPGAIAALTGGALLASGIGGFGAWHLQELGASRPPAAAAAAPNHVGATGPGRMPSRSRSAVATPTATAAASSRDLAAARARGSLTADRRGATDRAGGAVSAAGSPAGNAPKPSPGKVEARRFGPWQCGDNYTWDVGHPALARPCYSVGPAIRVQGTLHASPGVRADLSLAVQDAVSGRTVAGPFPCAGLRFTDAVREHRCGAFELNAPRGRRYVVVQTWRYAEPDFLPTGSARGPQFTW